jgi:hypothetical protein
MMPACERREESYAPCPPPGCCTGVNSPSTGQRCARHGCRGIGHGHCPLPCHASPHIAEQCGLAGRRHSAPRWWRRPRRGVAGIHRVIIAATPTRAKHATSAARSLAGSRGLGSVCSQQGWGSIPPPAHGARTLAALPPMPAAVPDAVMPSLINNDQYSACASFLCYPVIYAMRGTEACQSPWMTSTSAAQRTRGLLSSPSFPPRPSLRWQPPCMHAASCVCACAADARLLIRSSLLTAPMTSRPAPFAACRSACGQWTIHHQAAGTRTQSTDTIAPYYSSI